MEFIRGQKLIVRYPQHLEVVDYFGGVLVLRTEAGAVFVLPPHVVAEWTEDTCRDKAQMGQ